MAERALIPAYLSLGLQALTPIVIGSFKSLKVSLPWIDVLSRRRKRALPRWRTSADVQTPASTIARRTKAAEVAGHILTEDEEEDEGLDDEVLGWADSLAFPIFGSVALLGLWALLKYVGKEWINFFLGLYCESSHRNVAFPRRADGQSRARVSSHSNRLVEAIFLTSGQADSADIHDAGQLLHSSDILQAADVPLPDNVQPQAWVD